MKQNPCYKCEDRNAECHSTCQLYSDWVKYRYDYRAEAIKKECFEKSYNKYKKNLCIKAKRKKDGR